MSMWPLAKPAVLAAVTILARAFGDAAAVSTKLPARNRPDRFVTVSRVGGGMVNEVTDNARLLVECFGRTTGEVEQMANQARWGLRNSVSTTVEAQADNGDPIAFFIRGYSETGLADLPHPDIIDRERFQFIAELHIAANRYTSAGPSRQVK